MSEVKAGKAVSIVIDEAACTKCGACASECPVGVFRQAGKDTFPIPGHFEGCVSCGHCVAVCPAGAICHGGFPEGSIHAVDLSVMPSPAQALNMLRMRRSVRAFKNKAVERELVDRILEGARFAPTGHNVQNVEYVVVQDPATLEAVKKVTAEYYDRMVSVLKNRALVDSLPAPRRDALLQMMPALPMFEAIDRAFKAGADPVLRGAPNLLVFHSPRMPFDRVNTTLAVENAMLMCPGLGLGSFYIGFIQAIVDMEPKYGTLLGIPDDHGVHGIIAFGYPKYRYDKWPDRRPAKVTWIMPGDRAAIERLEAEEFRKYLEYWDNLSKNYDEDIDYDYGKGMRPLGAERLKKEGHFKRVVEFGCGTGFFSKVLLEMSDTVLVTDLSEKFLAIARDRLKGIPNAAFGIADCERTGMRDGEFDTAFTGLLGNSIDTEKAYSEIYRILKPGGSFIAYTVIFEMLDPEAKRQLFIRRTSRGKTGAPGYRERSIRDYRTSAEKAGFTVVAGEVVRDPTDPLSVPFFYMKCVK